MEQMKQRVVFGKPTLAERIFGTGDIINLYISGKSMNLQGEDFSRFIFIHADEMEIREPSDIVAKVLLDFQEAIDPRIGIIPKITYNSKWHSNDWLKSRIKGKMMIIQDCRHMAKMVNQKKAPEFKDLMFGDKTWASCSKYLSDDSNN